MSAADEAHNRETILRIGTMLNDVFVASVVEAHRSIKEGSELTGAPGQPVDTGALRNSWQFEFNDPNHATIGTNMEYAEPIEDGVGRFGPLTLQSSVGVFHSVKLTAANFDRVVAAVKARAPGGPNV
jgi:phage gpG-like protein